MNDKYTVDTVEVPDRDMPYETAVICEGFNNGKWIVVGWAETVEEAKELHQEWVEKLEAGVDEITDAYEEITYRRQ